MKPPDDQNIPLMRERIKELEEENQRLREAVKKTYREIHIPEPLSEHLGLTIGLAFAQSIMKSNFAALAAQEDMSVSADIQ